MFWSSKLCKRLLESCGTFMPTPPFSLFVLTNSRELSNESLIETKTSGRWQDSTGWKSSKAKSMNWIFDTLPMRKPLNWEKCTKKSQIWFRSSHFEHFPIWHSIYQSRTPFPHFRQFYQHRWSSVQSVNTFPGASSVIRLVQCTLWSETLFLWWTFVVSLWRRRLVTLS